MNNENFYFRIGKGEWQHFIGNEKTFQRMINAFVYVVDRPPIVWIRDTENYESVINEKSAENSKRYSIFLGVGDTEPKFAEGSAFGLADAISRVFQKSSLTLIEESLTEFKNGDVINISEYGNGKDIFCITKKIYRKLSDDEFKEGMKIVARYAKAIQESMPNLS